MDVLNFSEVLPGEVRDGITPIGSTETSPSTVSAVHVPVTVAAPPGAHQSVKFGKPPATVSAVHVPATMAALPGAHQSVKFENPPATVSAVPATASDPQSVKYRKRPIVNVDTETEDSQESQEGRRKRKKGKKAAKKETDEVDLQL